MTQQNNSQISSEVLNYLLENDMINVADVQEKIAMKKREEILKKHPYSIWEGTDGKWHTYLPDEKKGRVHRKRNSEKEIQDLIVSFYKGEVEKPISFDDVYRKWRVIKDSGVSNNTIAKYKTDYKRYFQSSEFAQKGIKDITAEDITFFMNVTIKQLKLCNKACKTLFWYIKCVFESAKINHILNELPTDGLSASKFYPICYERKRPMDKILVSNNEMKILYTKFNEDLEKTPEYIPIYALELASLTGMRVGEISALRWDSIKNGKIVIDKSEKYDRITKEYFIDTTKTGKEREFPITTYIQDLLDKIKKIEFQYGYICEWVFADQNGRIHAPVISSCIKNKCDQLGITQKGVHAFRRTLNSKMRMDGVPAVVAASLLGHSEEVNEKYYTFDITTDNEKCSIIEKANSQICV